MAIGLSFTVASVAHANDENLELFVTAQSLGASSWGSGPVKTLGKADLEAFHVDNGLNIQDAVPSLRTPTSGAPAEGASFRLRGFGSPVFQIGIDPAVSVYVDGVYRSRSGMAAGDLLDIERIEVFTGPQGTASAVSANTGVIQISSQRPKLGKVEGELHADLENYDRTSLSAVLNVPTSSMSALRVAGSRKKGDGWIADFWNSARTHNDLDRSNVRASWRWSPSPAIMIDVVGDWSRIDERCCAPIRINGYVGALQDLFGTSRPSPSPDQLRTMISEAQRSEMVDRGASVAINAQLSPDLVLSSMTAYRPFDSHTLADGDFSGGRIAAVATDISIDSLYHEVRLQKGQRQNTGSELVWHIGFAYRNERTSRLRAYEWGADVGRFFPPALRATPGPGPVDDLDQRAINYGVFAGLSVPIAAKLTMSGGLRVDFDHKSAWGNFDQSNLIILPRLNSSFRANVRDTVPSWSTTLSYQMTPYWRGFATYSRGHKAGGVNLAREAAGLVGSSAKSTFLAERVDHFETGIEGKLADQGVHLSVSTFLDIYSDVQNQVFLPPIFVVSNDAGARIWGFEAGGDWRISQAIKLSMNATHLDTRFTPGAQGQRSALTGARLGWAPAWTVSAGVDINVPLARSWSAFGSARALWRGAYRAAVAVDPRYNVGQTKLVSLRGGLSRKSITASLWCTNCFNQHYAEIMLPNALDPTGSAVDSYPGQPRRYGLAIAKRF